MEDRASPRDEPLRVLLMGGVETRFHHFDEVGPPLCRIVEEAGHRCTQLEAPHALAGDVLGRFDAIVSITTGGELSGSQEQRLLSAIAESKNDRRAPLHFLGLHGASCSFQNSSGYFEMLGGRFLGHPPMSRFDVHVEPPGHPVTAGLTQFEIEDEFYLLQQTSAARVILTGTLPDAAPVIGAGSGQRLPLGWVRTYGLGKVCYVALGHGEAQLRRSELRRLVTQALGWFTRAAP